MVTLPLFDEFRINKSKYFLLFETKLCDQQNYMSYLFTDPVRIIRANKDSEVGMAFNDIEKYSKKFYLAGYFSYELGYSFEKELFKDYPSSKVPLINLGVFDRRMYFDHRNGNTTIDNNLFLTRDKKLRRFALSNPQLAINSEDYNEKIFKIKGHIENGYTYQVNFSSRYTFNLSGSILSFYNHLGKRQKVNYSAFFKLGDEYVVSLSPELLFKRDGDNICSEPMKGTIGRGKNINEDKLNMKKLKKDPKEKAENLMIVDLVRNDLGRISDTGTVKVIEPFKVRKYDTLFQMTSEVRSRLKKEVTYFDIFRNLFPSGSVTGAPKIKTMQIIKELENSPRGIYCGALGFIAPGKKAVFNLPIRTISLVKNKGEMGIGSGIVYDSSAEKEFLECKLKAGFLTQKINDFKLIETILWDKDYKFYIEHFNRLLNSAKYFNFHCNIDKIHSGFKQAALRFVKGRQYKVRLLLSRDGGVELESSMIKVDKGVKRAAVSACKVDPEDNFLYHKTTSRNLYDKEYRFYKSKGYFDVVFLNKKEEYTEGAISNLIIKSKGKFYTPPLSSGLLPGVYRGYMIKRFNAIERIIHKEDILAADKVFLCNSLRGMIEVKLVDKPIK